MSDAEPKPKRKKIKHILRFACIACGFDYCPPVGVSYWIANAAVGKAGWRIEKRGSRWGSVCDGCATPDDQLPPLHVREIAA